MDESLSPRRVADAILTMLRIAEFYGQWGLLAALIRFVHNSDGRVARTEGVWAIESPKLIPPKPFKGITRRG